MSPGQQPRIREDLVCQALEDRFAVYDPVEDRTTFLNLTAGAVFELCDGTRTTAEMAAELARTFQEDERRILTDTELILRDLERRGFLAGQSTG